MLIPMNKVRAAVNAIRMSFKPARITLFGSYAYGKPSKDSDVDLLVLIAGRKPMETALKIRQSVDFGFPVDLIVQSPANYRKRISMGDWFLTDIEEKGKILYEATDAGMDPKSRRRFPHRAARNASSKAPQLR